MDPNQLRDLISKVLKDTLLFSEEAVELMMVTAAQESHCGEYIHQIKGSALGIFQMEPKTLKDLYDNFLSFRKGESKILNTVKSPFFDKMVNLEGNLLYQIVSARLQYRRFPEQIPHKRDYVKSESWIAALAEYWKEHWNTKKGKGKAEDAFENYYRYGY